MKTDYIVITYETTEKVVTYKVKAENEREAQDKILEGDSSVIVDEEIISDSINNIEDCYKDE